MYGISNSSFLLFLILTYLSVILTFCFPIGISKTNRTTISLCVAAKKKLKDAPVPELRRVKTTDFQPINSRDAKNGNASAKLPW